jgi:hypothetical protein
LPPNIFRFAYSVEYPHHRSGWPFAIRALAGLSGTDNELLLLDPVIEKTFASEDYPEHTRPWTGFLHCARSVPEHFNARKSPRHYFATERWRRSREHCVGLFVLAPSMAEWARDLSGVPVTALWHPTEFAQPSFSMDRYVASGREVVQVGWWLRRLASIHFLPVEVARKRLVVPHGDDHVKRFLASLESERRAAGAPPVSDWDAQIVPRLPDGEYDELLSRSVVFEHFYDVGACNAVLECMARSTPVLLNRLPALEDYLGARYPLFYRDLEEAGDFARDDERVAAAHEYLRGLDMGHLRAERFRAKTSAALLGLRALA